MMGAKSFSHREKVAGEAGRMRGYTVRKTGCFPGVFTYSARWKPLIRRASRDTFSLWEKEAPALPIQCRGAWPGMTLAR